MATELMTAYLSLAPKLEKGFGKEVQGQAEKDIDGKAIGGTVGSGFAEGFSKYAGKAAKAFASVFSVKMAADIGKAFFESYEAIDNGFDQVVIATGAAGEAAEQLRGVYGEVARSVTGDYEDIGAAIGELHTRLGLSGDELETAAEQTMKFAKVNGQDAKTAVQDVTRMMNDAGIGAEWYSTTLDVLTVAAQKSGIDVATLANSVTENAASFRELGFTTDESIALLAQFEKSGASTGQVLAGMKRGVAAWAKEGMSAREGFDAFVAGIKDGSVTSADAIEIFGSRAGVAMYDAVQRGQLDFAGMFEAIETGAVGSLDRVYDDTLDASEKIDLALRNINMDLVEQAAPLIEEAADVLSTSVIPAIGELAKHADVAVPAIGALALGFGAFKVATGVAKGISAIAGVLPGMAASGAAAGGGLSATAAGETAAGAAAGASAGNMFRMGAAVLMVGGGVALAAAGVWLLADAAIRLTQDGGAAVPVLAGLGAGILVLGVAAGAGGAALTAGAVGVLAFGAALLMVGIGVGIASAGIALLAGQLPTIAQYGAEAGANVLLLGTGLLVMGAGALVAGAGCIVLGAGLMVAAAGLLLAAPAMAIAAAGAGILGAALGLVAGAVLDVGTGAMDMGTGLSLAGEAMPAIADAAGGAALGIGELALAMGAASGNLLMGSSAMETAGTGATALAGGVLVASVAAGTAAAAFLQMGAAAQASMAQAAAAATAAGAQIRSALANLNFIARVTFNLGPLPHFSMSGSFNAETGSVPTINVAWYEKGGIFTRPSIIGVGEGREPEGVLPLSKIDSLLDGGGASTVNNYTINGITYNDDAEIGAAFDYLMGTLRRKGAMNVG